MFIAQCFLNVVSASMFLKGVGKTNAVKKKDVALCGNDGRVVDDADPLVVAAFRGMDILRALGLLSSFIYHGLSSDNMTKRNSEALETEILEIN